jgi:hypothetical protein
MTEKATGIKRHVGDFVKINLGDGFHTYGRILEEAQFAIYDCRSKVDVPIDVVADSAVLFFVSVMNHAVTKGRWPIVGSLPLSAALKNPPPRFMQDAINKNSFRIYQKGKIRPATREECSGLEREAVWEPTHVEDRIRDHYLGKPNKWFTSLQIRD